jgi:hypothetical protein
VTLTEALTTNRQHLKGALTFMATKSLTSTPNKTTATRDNGKVNVERLSEALSGMIGKPLTTESLEALILDAFGAVAFRLRSVEGEIDELDSREFATAVEVEQLTERMNAVESLPIAGVISIQDYLTRREAKRVH